MLKQAANDRETAAAERQDLVDSIQPGTTPVGHQQPLALQVAFPKLHSISLPPPPSSPLPSPLG